MSFKKVFYVLKRAVYMETIILLSIYNSYSYSLKSIFKEF